MEREEVNYSPLQVRKVTPYLDELFVTSSFKSLERFDNVKVKYKSAEGNQGCN